ncbi:unnamed protein product [Diabrotica balteata]|uniref:PWI domain-containing protein n=1 Tax=Diabrotica balteata TaxID=107213 RepID=A0A9N9XDY9_DIABA|nr:unnamed protein product [Diabrotica balteata]
MSYPGRPPIMQGLPMYMPMGAPTAPLMPAVMPIQHMVPIQVTSAPQIRAFPKLNPNREQQKQIQGPAVTVFVGNITEKAPDVMIRQILATCGHVISWKKVKAFGFCELAGPDAGLRAVRLLHDLMIGDKRLVAKVDAKTKTVLDEYKAERRKKQKGSTSPLQDEPEEEELDEETQALDATALERIKQIMKEYEEEMSNYESKKEVLAEAEVEEEKRDLITREIGKFREIMKKQEEEKEVRKKKEEQKEKSTRDRDRSHSHSPSPRRREKDEKKRRRSRSRSHEKSRERDRDREREKERERDRDREREREREKERERERERERDRDRERERDRDREREKDRDRERDREDRRGSRDMLKEKEMEEEAKEKKKAERRAREKEAAYQERLRAWETRERRKAKDYEKEREKERTKEEERERDAKRLKEFLEDYDDERDDLKYYKGRELQKRLAERVKEADGDVRDRCKEKEEIEELKNRIFSGEHEDPSAEFERIKREREEQYKPKLLIDVNLEHWKQKEREKERELERQKARERERMRELDRERDRQRKREEREKYIMEQAAQELAAVEAEPIDSDSDMEADNHYSPAPPEPDNVSMDNSNSAQWTQVQAPDEDSKHSFISNHDDHVAPPTGTGMKITLAKPITLQSPTRDSKRRKSDLREVFNPDEDDSNTQIKKRKLVPLDYNEDKKSKREKENGEKKSEETKSQEEKRRNIKSLIERIPTEKEALFAYHLDWSAIDSVLMEKKIRPWINKKIIEYIGEPEPTLVDFICSKVLAGSQPQVILEDVQMVLDEEAEVFVVKMWRLLIYEVEAKKLGIGK